MSGLTNGCVIRESRLHELIAARQDLYEHNRSLIRQLSDIQARHRNTCELDSVMESLQSHLLTRKEEEDFRNAFLSVYPSALLHLREACPAVTRSEGTVLLLVLLKQSNEELGGRSVSAWQVCPKPDTASV